MTTTQNSPTHCHHRAERPDRTGPPGRLPDPAPRPRHGRGAGPGLHRPGPRRRRRARRRLQRPARATGPTTRTGRTATGSCSRSATTPSRCTRRWPRPGSSRSRSWRPTARTTPGCRCPAMASYTPGMEISGGSLGHGLGVATGMALGLRLQGNPARVYQPAVRRRARRGLDLGGRDAGRPPRPGQPAPRSSTSTPCRPTARPPACCAPSRSPTSGRRSGGTRCASTATTSRALVDAFDELARRTAARPRC